jgi:hypothetical protein
MSTVSFRVPIEVTGLYATRGKFKIVFDAQELAGWRVTLEMKIETRTTPGDRSSPYRALPTCASRFAL